MTAYEAVWGCHATLRQQTQSGGSRTSRWWGVGGGVAILVALLVDSVTMESAARQLDDPFTRFLQWLHTPIVFPLWMGVLVGACLYAGTRASASVLHRLQRTS
jgi:hypothetical protein